MKEAFIKLKFRKIFLIELISLFLLVIGGALFESISTRQNIILLIVMYFVPSVWIIYGLSKYGSSVKELFKPIKCNKASVATTITMTFIMIYCLFLSMQLAANILSSTAIYNSKEFSIIHILSTVIIAPAAEELFFRGYLLNKLMTKVNIKKAIIFSSMLFAMIHFVSLIGAFIIGACLALIYIKYRNLSLTMLVHSLYNGMILLYKFLIYTNAFTISAKIAPFLLILTISLLVISSIWIFKSMKHTLSA